MTSAAPLTLLSDFSDRLSPMVVKELRQGLRTRLFALTMLILHGLLIIVTLINGVNTKGEDTSWMLEGLSILALCILMPLRGFSAVSDEMQRKTLDMLVLTRLSAVRIVFGKWLSIVLQSLLVALSLMPYVVASYVYGGTNLFHELEMLGLKWLIGIVIAAAIVCLSTQRQFGLRAAVVGLALLGPGLASLVFGMMWSRLGSTGSFASITAAWPAMNEGVIAVWIIASSLWLIFACLSLAATRIAPAGSNLASVKRTVHAAVMLILLIVASLSRLPGLYAFMAVSTVAWFATLDALVERENFVSSVLIPFYRRGLLGRMACWFLAPGWPNGMLYSLFMTLGLTACGFMTVDADAGSIVWLSVAEVWLIATILHLFIARRVSDLLAPYIGISILLAIVNMFVSLLAQLSAIGTGGMPWLSVILPSTVVAALQLMKVKGGSAPEVEQFRWLGLGISCLWPLILGLLAAHALRKARPLREEARRLAANP